MIESIGTIVGSCLAVYVALYWLHSVLFRPSFHGARAEAEFYALRGPTSPYKPPSPPARPRFDQDAHERRLFEADRTAFWLDPDRWNAPIIRGRHDIFWMHERPDPNFVLKALDQLRIEAQAEMMKRKLELNMMRCGIERAADLFHPGAMIRIDDLGRPYFSKRRR